MKKLAPLLLAVCLFMLMQPLTGYARQTPADEAAIRVTLNNYIEGRNGGDLDRLQKAFHRSATLKFVQTHTKELGDWSLNSYLKRLKPGQQLNCKGEITDIRIFNDAAQATVLLIYPDLRFHDYMSLLKIEGQWLIVDKIFARKSAEETTAEAKAVRYKGKKSDEYGYDMKPVKCGLCAQLAKWNKAATCSHEE